jgi:hypothetical protein
VRLSTSVCAILVVCAVAANAGPVEFGMSELNAALAARKLKWKAKTELSLDPPETYRIEPYTVGGAHITGGDLRGLMYGLLEAADQVRANGRLALVHGVPATATRGIRIFVHMADLEKPWYTSEEFWREYFQLLARNRFNRFNLIFTTPHSAPPYPYWVAVDGFGGVRVPGLTPDRRERNLRTLRFLSQTAAEYAIDFTLGIWEKNDDSDSPNVEGLTGFNLTRYRHEALRKLISACPMIRGVQILADPESGLSPEQQAAFVRDSVFPALGEAGHRVTLDVLGPLRQPGLLRAAEQAGIALRLSDVPWPAGFEIDPPVEAGRWEPDRHPLFYWLWGRLGYDPKTKPPKGEKVEEYRAAGQVIRLLADAHFSDPNMYTWPLANPGVRIESLNSHRPEDWGPVATIGESVQNRISHIASAKQTPLETADLLTAEAANLEKAGALDFKLLSQLARYHAYKQRAAYDIQAFDQARDGKLLDQAENELGGAAVVWESAGGHRDLLDLRLGFDLIAQRRKDQNTGTAIQIPEITLLPIRPQLQHTPVKNSVPDQPLTLTIQITPSKDVASVRLHYRATNPALPPKTVEEPGSSSVSFTIPGPDIPVNWDLVYYFEILTRENRGWFEPDPSSGTPYYVVKIAAPTGP